MKKAIKWIVIVVLLLIIVGVGLVWVNLNSIIRSTVESQGTQQLQVATKLGGVNLSLFGGSLSLNDFSIGSPKGFTAEKMLELGEASVNVKMDGLRGEPKRIDAITLKKPKLVIEQSGLSLNFKALVDGLPKGEPAPTPEPKTGEPTEPMKLIIDQINITGAEVEFRAGIPGLDKGLTIPIPDMVIKQIGNADGAANGAALKDVVMQVITGMVSAAADSDKIPAPLKALLKGNLADVASQLGDVAKKEVIDRLGNVGGGTTKAVGDVLSGKVPTTQGIGDAAGDLLKGFGSKKKDKDKK